MTSTERENLQKNLSRLRRKSPAMAKRVEQANSQDCEIVEGQRGAVTVICNGIQLASSYDPRREGTAIAAEILAKKADIVIAIGFGLCHHLEAVRAKSTARLIVYEPSAERMKAALSARPGLMFLSDNLVDFADTKEQLFRLIDKRYISGLKLQVYVHPPTFSLAPDNVREAVETVSRAKDFVDIMIGTRVRDLANWGRTTMRNVGSICKSPSFRELFGRFRNVPAVVVSAGPSLDKQLPSLIEYRDRVLIICIGQALGSLRSAGIEPDLVHILESKRVEHQLSRVGSSDTTNLVVTNDVTEELFRVPVRSRFVVSTTADKVGRWIAGVLDRNGWTFGGSTVAHGAVSMAVAVGANPIMLIGQDLAYTDGRHYAKDSAYDKVTIKIGDDGYSTIDSSSRMDLLKSTKDRTPKRVRVIQVDGWYGEKVATSPSYAGFIDSYQGLAKLCAERGSQVLNCTEGGAHIPGLEHSTFLEALEQHAPKEAVDAHRIVTDVFDQWTPADPGVFPEEIARVHNLLNKLERKGRKGEERCAAATRELPRTHSPQRQIDLLRRIGRLEKDVRQLLLDIPWIDAVVQPELATSLAEVRRSKNVHATPEQAVSEAQFLFEATQNGVVRARELLDCCSESLDRAVTENISKDGRPLGQQTTDRKFRNSNSPKAHSNEIAASGGARQGPVG